MTRLVTALAATLAAGAVAAAQEMPMPKVFRDSPFQKGQWRMEILEMNAKGAERAGGGMPGGMQMTMCMDDLREMARNRADAPGREQRDCKVQILKDTATEAVMETTCPDGTTRATVTREGDKSFLMQAAGTQRGESYSMKARYTYDGPKCSQQSGMVPGMGMSMDKNSPECQQAQAQLSSMNPGAMCANAGANRAMCEQNVQRMRAQLEAMCK